MKYTITLQGIERFLDAHDEQGLFDKIALPSGIVKSDLIITIFRKCQDLELVNSDPWSLQLDVKSWFATHYDTFDAWVKALNKEYDPIENYYKKEKLNDKGSFHNEGEHTDGNTNTTTNLQTDVDLTNTDKHAAFNKNSGDSTYAPYEQHTTDGYSSKVNGTITDVGGGTAENDGWNVLERNRTVSGRYGYTPTQTLIEEEIKLRRFNIYEEIANLFKETFCLLIYG